jgi:hypothetical protein
MEKMSAAELLARVPVRAVAFETLEDGRVVLLRPKFTGKGLAWFQRLLPRPVFRVRLDAKGTFIWETLDGLRTAQEVCDAVRARFGAEAEPVEERTAAFLYQMASGEFLRLEERPGSQLPI